MSNYSDPTRRDVVRSIVYILIYVIAISAGAYFLIPRYWYWWAAIVLVGLALLVNWHRTQTVYRCPNCDHVYTISFLTDLLAPHGILGGEAWLLLRCPNCRQRHKTKVLKRVE